MKEPRARCASRSRSKDNFMPAGFAAPQPKQRLVGLGSSLRTLAIFRFAGVMCPSRLCITVHVEILRFAQDDNRFYRARFSAPCSSITEAKTNDSPPFANA